MSYQTLYTPAERDLVTLADLVELAGSATLVQRLASAIAAERGRPALVKEVVDCIFELRREAADDAIDGEPLELEGPALATV